MDLIVFEDLGAVVLVFVEEGVVFLAVAGLEARCRFEADGLAVAAVFFLVDAVFTPALLSALGSGSVLTA